MLSRLFDSRCALLLGALSVAVSAAPAAATITLVSVDRSGTTSRSGSSENAVMTPDGRFVAFTSFATDLVSGVADGNGAASDVFVRDVRARTTMAVSVTPFGTATGNDGSDSPAISADGQVVAFVSLANDLSFGPGDGNGPLAPDIFVRDLTAKRTTLVSINNAGTASGNGGSAEPVLTPDGRYVAFVSSATDLVATDTNGATDVFVRDVIARTTTLASFNAAGTDSGNAHSSPYSRPAITPDGRFVAFASLASDLVPNDTNGAADIFVRDLVAGTTILVSINGAGTASGNADSFSAPAISADGRFVAFASDASDLVARDTNGATDVFVRDLLTGTTTLVSVDSVGTDSGSGNSGFLSVVMTPDGRFVAFESNASNLVTGDNNNTSDVFVRDLTAQTTTLVSVNRAGTGSGNDASSLPEITPDGQFVSFSSDASDLVDSDINVATDVFLRDLTTGTTTLVSANRTGTGSGNGSSPSSSGVSADGQFVAFVSAADDLVPNDPNTLTDVFRFGFALDISDFAILRWPPPDATAPANMRAVLRRGSKTAGPVCGDSLALLPYARLDGDAIALRTGRPGVLFRHPQILGNLVTGGAPITGPSAPSAGGRIDTSGTGPELGACTTAAARADATRAQLLTLPGNLTLGPITLAKGRSLRISATAQGATGQVIIDIPRVRLGPRTTLVLSGDSTTTMVIVRIRGTDPSFTLGHGAQLQLVGLRPEQVLWLVDGPVVLARYSTFGGSVLTTGTITVGRAARIDGALLSSLQVTLGPYAVMNLHPFEGFQP